MRRILICGGLFVFCFFGITQGCFEGGANFNMKSAGNNGQGGVNVGGGSNDPYKIPTDRRDVAVSPQGEYALARIEDELVQGDLIKGKAHRVSEVGAPERVAFAYKARRYYLTVESGSNPGIYAVDSVTRKVVWKSPLTAAWDLRLYPSRDDAFLVVSTYLWVEIRDASTGKLRHTYNTSVGIKDVDITPDSGSVLITESHTWTGSSVSTPVVRLDPKTGATDTITVPNCSSPLVLSPDGLYAFIAPTTCNKDPVSVIDLKAGKWKRNLPGFGPVAMALDGTTAVAFLDATNVDASLFDDKTQIPSASGDRYHMMLIDTTTLRFGLVAVGDSLPRYAVSRDGKVVLVDSIWLGTMDRIRLLEASTGKLHEITSSLTMRLNHFVLSPNNKDVYLLDGDLLGKLSIPQRLLSLVSTTVIPQSLNITLDGETLLMLDWNDKLHLMDTNTEKVTREIKLR